MAGVTLLAYGVVFVLLIGEIDLSISYISGIAGVVVAQMTLPESGHQVPGLVAILACHSGVHGDRGVPGLLRGLHRRPGLRRHPRGLPDLAGRDPEVDRERGRHRHPGRGGEQHRQLLLLEHGRLDHRCSRVRGVRRKRAGRGDLSPPGRRPGTRSGVHRREAGIRGGRLDRDGDHLQQGPRRPVRPAPDDRRAARLDVSSPSGRPSAGTSTPSAATPRRPGGRVSTSRGSGSSSS